MRTPLYIPFLKYLLNNQNNNYLPTFITLPLEYNLLLIIIDSYLYSGLIKPMLQSENQHILH